MPAVKTDDFLTKSHEAITVLREDCRTARRAIDNTHACPDRAPCKHCARILFNHECINDHLDQIDLYNLDPAPQGRECGMCGRIRYTDGAQIVCAGCDGLTGSATWVRL